jgi:DNA-binding NarL/FixJ family response regulator
MRTAKAQLDSRDLQDLQEIKALTKMMREHEKQISKLSTKRRNTVLRLRGKAVGYTPIATAMGTSEQTVYIITRKP